MRSLNEFMLKMISSILPLNLIFQLFDLTIFILQYYANISESRLRDGIL